MTERRMKINAMVDWLHRHEGDLNRQITQRRPNTCVEVEVLGYTQLGIGFTKACWPDKWNPERGISLAFDKAVKHLAVQFVDSDTVFEGAE